MAEVSRRLRNARRLKRQNTLLYRAIRQLSVERDVYKNALQQVADKTEEAAKKHKLTITKLPDEPDATIDSVPEEFNAKDEHLEERFGLE